MAHGAADVKGAGAQAPATRKQISKSPADKKHPIQKGLRRRNSPTCTLSQNGYGTAPLAAHNFLRPNLHKPSAKTGEYDRNHIRECLPLGRRRKASSILQTIFSLFWSEGGCWFVRTLAWARRNVNAMERLSINASQPQNQRAHPDLNQGPADLQSAALTTELCTQFDD